MQEPADSVYDLRRTINVVEIERVVLESDVKRGCFQEITICGADSGFQMVIPSGFYHRWRIVLGFRW